MTEAKAPGDAATDVVHSRPAPPVALSDDRNPAIIDGRKTFAITVISTALFIGAVVLFIL
jgi:hypothetical protein